MKTRRAAQCGTGQGLGCQLLNSGQEGGLADPWDGSTGWDCGFVSDSISYLESGRTRSKARGRLVCLPVQDLNLLTLRGNGRPQASCQPLADINAGRTDGRAPLSLVMSPAEGLRRIKLVVSVPEWATPAAPRPSRGSCSNAGNPKRRNPTASN